MKPPWISKVSMEFTWSCALPLSSAIICILQTLVYCLLYICIGMFCSSLSQPTAWSSTAIILRQRGEFVTVQGTYFWGWGGQEFCKSFTLLWKGILQNVRMLWFCVGLQIYSNLWLPISTMFKMKSLNLVLRSLACHQQRFSSRSIRTIFVCCYLGHAKVPHRSSKNNQKHLPIRFKTDGLPDTISGRLGSQGPL